MRRTVSALALALALAACGKSKPEGQVVAVVNGEEITRPELNAILQNLNVPPKADKAAVQNSVLDQLVTERLVVQSAKQLEIDKSQDYLIASRRANDQILSELLSRRIVSSLRTAYAQDIQRYIAANPSRFANRTVIVVDQVRVPQEAIKGLDFRNLHTLDAVIGLLRSRNAQFQRGRATLDSATLPSDAFRQIMSLPPGEPFTVTQGGQLLISAVIGQQVAPIQGELAKRVAMQLLQQDTAREALTRRLDTLRRAAKITYQDGFGPPPKPPTTSPARLTANETWAPCATRVSTSCPKESVPNGCSGEGGCRMLA